MMILKKEERPEGALRVKEVVASGENGTEAIRFPRTSR
jgi:hypothetical protein